MKKSGFAASFALAACCVLGGCGVQHPAVHASAGTIYAGISPDTGRGMDTTQADAPGTRARTYNWEDGKEYCAALVQDGHRDWRVPSKGELNVLFQNRAAIGGFNETGSIPAGWYWSSSQSNSNGAWDQRFSDGSQDYDYKGIVSSLRCVR